MLATGTFALTSDAFVIAGVLPRLASDLSVPVGMAGQMVTLYALVYAFASPALASLVARWPKKRTVIVALCGFACAEVACAAAPNFAALLVARIATALFAALYTPTAYAMAGELAPPAQRGAALSKVALGTSAGTVVGVPVSTLIADELGWRVAFVLACVLSALAMLALVRFPSDTAAANGLPPFAVRARAIAKAPIMLAILATFLWSVSTYTVYTYVGVIFGLRLELRSTAALLLAYGLGGLLGSQSGGRIIDRFGTYRPLLIAVSVSAVNLALMRFTSGTLASCMAALFVMSFCTWVALLAQQSRLIAFAPANGAMLISFLISGIYVGSALGAALGGILIATLGPFAPPNAAAAVSFGGLVLFLLSVHQGETSIIAASK